MKQGVPPEFDALLRTYNMRGSAEGWAEEQALKQMGITRGCCRVRFLAYVSLSGKHLKQRAMEEQEKALRRPNLSRYSDCDLAEDEDCNDPDDQ